MNIVKRDGRTEEFDIEKIHDVLFWSTQGIKGVNVSDIEIKIGLQLTDGIESKTVHQILIQSCADLITEKTPNYQHVAGNLLNFYLRKEVFNTSDNMPPLLDVIKCNVEEEVYDSSVLEKYTEQEIRKLDNVIKHKRDYDFVYAGLQQLIDKYLLKDRSTGIMYETPQYMYMLICMTLLADEKDSIRRHRLIKDLYRS